MNDRALDQEIENLYAQLKHIQREYEAAAKPFVDRLMRLESMRAPRHTIPIDVLNEFYLTPNILKE